MLIYSADGVVTVGKFRIMPVAYTVKLFYTRIRYHPVYLTGNDPDPEVSDTTGAGQGGKARTIPFIIAIVPPGFLPGG